jgi:heme a synthase
MTSFRRLSVVSTVATLALITLGAVVRSTDSGLGCSDHWPGCNGSVIPDFTNHHVVIEFSHRFVALIVMVLIATMAVRAFKGRASQPQLFVPTLSALLLVFFQAGLGAVVVKLELEAESVVIHMVTAMSLLALLIYISALAAPSSSAFQTHPVDTKLSKTMRWSALGVLALMAVGSYMSGVEGSGRVFNDWPLMDGALIPDLGIELMAVHFLHRAVALVVGVALVVAAMGVLRRKSEFPTAAKLVHAAIGLFGLEVLIGAGNVWFDLNPVLVTSHLLVSASIWACLFGASLVLSPALRHKLQTAHATAPSAPATA